MVRSFATTEASRWCCRVQRLGWSLLPTSAQSESLWVSVSERRNDRDGLVLLLRRRLSGDWHLQLENGAPDVRFDQPQPSSAPCDQVGGDGQSQPHTALLRREERVEDAFLMTRCDAGARVLDRQMDRCAAIDGGFQTELPLIGGDRTHCVNRVLAEVKDNLLKLSAVQGDRRHVALKLRRY